MKLAGVMATRNYSRFPGAFPVLAAMSDVTIVLEDGSEVFPYKHEVTEYLCLLRHAEWNDEANRTLLLYRAFVMGCRWVLQLDDDMLPSKKLFSSVRELLRHDVDIVYVSCRDLWDDAAHYRVDGVWGQKDYPLLIRNWFFEQGISVASPVRLHRPPLPCHRPRQVVKAPDDYAVYHLGSLHKEDRTARVNNYAKVDADHQFQADYAYLADETGLRRQPVPMEDHVLLHQWMRC